MQSFKVHARLFSLLTTFFLVISEHARRDRRKVPGESLFVEWSETTRRGSVAETVFKVAIHAYRLRLHFVVLLLILMLNLYHFRELPFPLLTYEYQPTFASVEGEFIFTKLLQIYSVTLAFPTLPGFVRHFGWQTKRGKFNGRQQQGSKCSNFLPVYEDRLSIFLRVFITSQPAHFKYSFYC